MQSFSITQHAHDDGTFGAVDRELQHHLSADVRFIQIDDRVRTQGLWLSA